jgi:hypothetical protein
LSIPVFPKTLPSPSFRSKYLFSGLADYLSDFSTLISADKGDQHDDGSVETESNHVRAVHFWGEMLQFRTARPKNSANIEIRRQVLIFEDFTG